ncbi:hypothetical protein CSUI_004285 [Cystoisospora suis]|uniref:Uncharacterized protein n=1 Tax=Cystoisospora suis TaxID=483139 RepID=A0A2C6KXU5_9APIC|nr:hypothetical protein CSUI_004285 [Cystoisospora suis]
MRLPTASSSSPFSPCSVLLSSSRARSRREEWSEVCQSLLSILPTSASSLSPFPCACLSNGNLSSSPFIHRRRRNLLFRRQRRKEPLHGEDRGVHTQQHSPHSPSFFTSSSSTFSYQTGEALSAASSTPSSSSLSSASFSLYPCCCSSSSRLLSPHPTSLLHFSSLHSSPLQSLSKPFASADSQVSSFSSSCSISSLSSSVSLSSPSSFLSSLSFHFQQKRFSKWSMLGGLFGKSLNTPRDSLRLNSLFDFSRNREEKERIAELQGHQRNKKIGGEGGGKQGGGDVSPRNGIFGAASTLEERVSKFLSGITDAESRQLKKQELLVHRFYRFVVISLMQKEGIFTFYDFYQWRQGCYDYLKNAEEELQGIVAKSAKKLADLGWESLRPSSSPEFKKIELHLRILSHFTAEELQRDTAQKFTLHAIQTIAKAAGAKVEDVKDVLYTHATALTDRTWYMRLMEMGRPIPSTFEDYMLQAETDRPYIIRLPYGETFYTYELEASREKAKHRRREKERNGEIRRYGVRIDRLCQSYTPNLRISYDRWQRVPQSRVDPYSNFLYRLSHLPPKSRVAEEQALVREKERDRIERDSSFYPDECLSAVRIRMTNLPRNAFSRKHGGMVRKSGEIHHLPPPSSASCASERIEEIRDLYGDAVERMIERRRLQSLKRMKERQEEVERRKSHTRDNGRRREKDEDEEDSPWHWSK